MCSFADHSWLRSSGSDPRSVLLPGITTDRKTETTSKLATRKESLMTSSPGWMRLMGIALLAASFGILACHETKPFLMEDTTEVTATVTSVDPNTRLLGLKDAAGRDITVEVDPAVRNL